MAGYTAFKDIVTARVIKTSEAEEYIGTYLSHVSLHLNDVSVLKEHSWMFQLPKLL